MKQSEYVEGPKATENFEEGRQHRQSLLGDEDDFGMK